MIGVFNGEFIDALKLAGRKGENLQNGLVHPANQQRTGFHRQTAFIDKK
jgi:hypothetical protein